MNYPLEGSCQCGSVKLRLLAAPQMVVACHCRECQKLSTSSFSLTAMVKTTDIEIHGELKDWQRTAESGNINGAKFCPGCGNRIYHYNPAQPDMIKLKPTYFSDTGFIRPTVHVWTSEKQDWVQIPDGVKVVEKQL